MADAPGLGANVGTAWVALRFSARGAKQDIEKQIEQELGGSTSTNSSGGLGSVIGSKIGQNISKSIAGGVTLDPAAKEITKHSGGFSYALSRVFGAVLGGNGSGSKGFIAGVENASNALDGFLSSGTALINPFTIALAGLAAVISGPLFGAALPIMIGFAGFAKVATTDIEDLIKATGKGKAGAKALKALPDGLRPLLPQLKSIKSLWHSVEQAIQPTVIIAFGQAIKIIRQLMPAIGPLFVAAGDAADAFLGNISKWLKSPSGQRFMTWLEVRGPQDIANFGKVMWALARTVGWIFAQLVKNGNQWISNTREVIGGVTEAYRNMRRWIYDDFMVPVAHWFTQSLPNAWRSFLKDVKDVGKQLMRYLSDERQWIYDDFIYKIIGFFLHTLPRGISAGWDSVIKFTKSIPGRVGGALASLGKLMFNIGKTALTQLWDGAKSKVGSIFSFFKSLAGSVLGILSKIWHINSPSKAMMKLGVGLMDGLHKGLEQKYGKVTGFISRMGKNVTSGVAQWTGLVHKALSMLSLPQSLTGNVLYQMQTESDGNPNAINLWDSNAAAGDPSRGLMQVIGSTFAAYHVAGTSDNIYNPLANIAAAINYAMHRYGPTLMSGGMGIGSGHGYDSGGIANGLGFLPKYTPKPERVLSPAQTSAFERLVDVLDGKSGGSRDIRITGGKLQLDMSRSEAYLRNISAQEAVAEIAFHAR